MRQALFLCAVAGLAISFAFAGGARKKGAYEAVPDETQPASSKTPATFRDLDWSRMTPLVGTYTTLSGFYDYQSNGGSIQHIRVNSANGNIHVTYMTSADSSQASLNTSRRVVYAFSSNGGASWQNFNNVQVPTTRAGFPTIDLLKGGFAGSPVIASHPDGTPTIAKLFVDSPEGSGAFSELTSPPVVPPSSGLQPIWPYVASASDGSVIVAASQNSTVTTGVSYFNRLQNDYTTWNTSWEMWPGNTQSGGRYPVQANGTGRVGILWNTANGQTVLGDRWKESTDNGVTWSDTVNLFPFRVAGADTFYPYVHADFVYDGNNPLFVFSEYYFGSDPNRADEDIVFYSQATGFKVAVPYDTSKYGPYNTALPQPQRFHNLLTNFPSIGLSGSTIVIAYQAFQRDTDAYGFNYSDLWYVASSNGGNTWGAPQRITNTPTTDERYPSVSKWNAPGQFNMVWSQKTPGHSGLFAFPGPDGARGVDTVRTFQTFLRVSPIQFTSSVGGSVGLANSFSLEQNFPNPFNPATKINYTVARRDRVTIKVFDVIGREVATLLNEDLSPGSYQVAFDATRLSSGVYYYRMTAGNFVETRKMIALK